jgi:NADP-dependent 3-hydroxy acid dehydrogenase YdfG
VSTVVWHVADSVELAQSLSLASRQARLVVVGRSVDAPHDVVVECNAFGAKAIEVCADTTQPNEIEAVVEKAIDSFGGIDTWINAASALVVGDLEAQSDDDISRIVDTNVFGPIGSSAHFQDRICGRDSGKSVCTWSAPCRLRRLAARSAPGMAGGGIGRFLARRP